MDPEEFLFILVSVMAFILGVVSGQVLGKDTARKEAARLGAAYYTVDQNGESKFKYITE